MKKSFNAAVLTALLSLPFASEGQEVNDHTDINAATLAAREGTVSVPYVTQSKKPMLISACSKDKAMVSISFLTRLTVGMQKQDDLKPVDRLRLNGVLSDMQNTLDVKFENLMQNHAAVDVIDSLSRDTVKTPVDAFMKHGIKEFFDASVGYLSAKELENNKDYFILDHAVLDQKTTIDPRSKICGYVPDEIG